ncbi:MAG: hypothetical protein EP329_10090 [Deltaproteobacteria bacterium]|nr:MAG: hypothetical protein EP329_10090 [Deltaproteobacteria bacterium]
MNKITMAALAGMATMWVGAGTAFAGESDAERAPYYEPMCQVDAECAEGEICLWGSCYVPEACAVNADCWTDWCGSDGFCAEPPTCTEDAECGDGNICDYGRCAPRGRTCLSDSECGEFAHCVFDSYTTVEVGTASSSATDPAQGSGSASSDGAADPDESPAPPEGEDIPYPPYVERGECRIDVEVVPESADCRAMCELAAACAAEQMNQVGQEPTRATDTAEPTEADAGGGSADSASGAMPACDAAYDDGEAQPGCMDPYDEDEETPDPMTNEEMIAMFVDQCTVMCSYGVATEAGSAADVSAASACLASQTSCDAMETACEDEIEVIGEMFDAISEQVDDDMLSAGGSGGDVTSALDPAKGTTDDGNVQELAGSPAPETGACNGSGGGAPLGLALLAAMMLLVWRRRTA